MPQSLLIDLTRQEDAPAGYRPEVYGPWPTGGAWIVKMRVASFWKSTRNPANFHTVTYIFSSHSDPSFNPLLMGEGLEQLMGSFCSGCKAGARTAASCLHRIAGIILLCGAQCFDTAKVQEPVYLDTARFFFCCTFYLNPFIGQTRKYPCTVVHLRPSLVVTEMSCFVFHLVHQKSSQIVGVTHLEIFLPDMVMDLLELCCLLDMIKTFLMMHILQKTFRISTLTNCLDKMLGKGGVNNGNGNSSKITSKPIYLLF